MTEEKPTPEEEGEKPTPPEGSKSEEKPDEEPGEEPEDDRVTKLEKDIADLKKGVAKAFSEGGLREEEEAKAPEHDDEIMMEVALAKYPDAEHVLDQAKDIAKKTGRSLLKVLREEPWLMEKAKSVAESEKSKKKVGDPSHQIEGEIDFKNVTADQIAKMSDKDYKKYQDYQRKKSVTPGRITL